MTAQHTQEWRIEKQQNNLGNGYSYVIRSEEEGYIAKIYSSEYAENDDVREARARLISAAPKLLEALQSIMSETSVEVIELHPAKWQKIRAAIAQATGQS